MGEESPTFIDVSALGPESQFCGLLEVRPQGRELCRGGSLADGVTVTTKMALAAVGVERGAHDRHVVRGGGALTIGAPDRARLGLKILEEQRAERLTVSGCF